ncbi:MAG TPA: 4-hydroxybenzoate polyprenyltransferase, partial [Phycisphaerales bacterium]|nr:4-hydroxybenzoate polyprenyltransferase [Phycisphaerales bacterium]
GVAMLTALALLATIVAYDAGAKRVPVVGPLVMGLCRALSLLLGATASWGAGAL